MNTKINLQSYLKKSKNETRFLDLPKSKINDSFG